MIVFPSDVIFLTLGNMHVNNVGMTMDDEKVTANVAIVLVLSLALC